MAENQPNQPIHQNYKISANIFRNRIIAESEAGMRFCFVLGSGASVESKIPMGKTLIKDWRNHLVKTYDREEILSIMRDVNIPEEHYEKLIQPGKSESDYQSDSKNYFPMFDMRYPNQPVVAYKALRELMEKAEPSFGYYMLALILEHTKHRLVITTNFDSLTEDTVFYTTGRHALVIGHESLADLLSSMENMDAPTVAKVHRDLLYHPLNRTEELEKLSEKWKTLASRISGYTPIVIGYAGGDNTLMPMLKSVNLNGIYWCGRDEDMEDEEIRSFLQSGSNNYYVRINGFDAVMPLIATALIGEDLAKLAETLEKNMSTACKNRVNNYNAKRKLFLQPQPVISEFSSIPMKNTSSEESAAPERPTENEDSSQNKPNYFNCIVEYRNENYTEALSMADRLVGTAPGDARYHNLRGAILHEMGRHEEALMERDKAVELAPENAQLHNNRGATLHEMGRYEEALMESDKAVELALESARFHNTRGVTLHAMGRYEEALKEKNQAVELAPENAKFHDSRGTTLHEMGRYEEALMESDKAVELAPESARFHNSRSVTLHTMGRYEEALKEIDKAVELAPENAGFHDNRGATLHVMGRYEEALMESDKAVELVPENAQLHNSRSVTLHEMGRYEEALEEQMKAVKMDSGKTPAYLYGLCVAYFAMKRYTEALEAITEALKIAQDNKKYHFCRSEVLRVLGRMEEAEEEAKTAENAGQKNAGYYFDRARVRHGLHQWKEAIDEIDRAIALEPENLKYQRYREQRLAQLA